jgi:hypothetical protein
MLLDIIGEDTASIYEKISLIRYPRWAVFSDGVIVLMTYNTCEFAFLYVLHPCASFSELDSLNSKSK